MAVVSWDYQTPAERTEALRGYDAAIAVALVIGVAVGGVLLVRQERRLTQATRRLQAAESWLEQVTGEVAALRREHARDRNILDTALRRIYAPEELVGVYTHVEPREYQDTPLSHFVHWSLP